MKRLSLTIILLLIITFVFQLNLAMGDRDFRLLDPINGGRYGKAPSAGPPFMYFSSSSQYYHLDDDEYDDFEDAVSNAFSSWEDNTQVGFSSSVSSGVPLVTWYSSSGYPGIVNPGSTGVHAPNYVISPSSSEILLNTFHDWDDEDQDIENHKFDVESITVHEIGHLYGIAHPVVFTSGANAPTMAGGDNEYFWDSLEGRSLEDDDIDAARFLQLRVPSLYSTIESVVAAADDIGIGFINVADGSYTLANTVIINTDISMEIEAGADLEFGADKTLRIEGALIANGTSGDRITFDKSGASDWWGIRFNDSSDDDDCSLTYCTIENADYPVYCATADPRIANCTIQNSAIGIYLYYPDSPTNWIASNTLTSNTSYGVWQAYGDAQIHGNEIYSVNKGLRLDNGDGKVQGNTIRNNTGSGVFMDGSDHTIVDNLIYSNGSHGINCTDYSDPYFRFANHGNNTIRNNTRNGVLIDATSFPDMSAYSNISASAHSLYSNGASYDEVASSQSSWVKAEYNYWGASTPSASRFSGNVDYNPYRSTDPNKMLALETPELQDSPEVEPLPSASLPSNKEAQKIFYEGYLLQGEEKYDEALINFKTVIANYPASFEAMMALSRIRMCLKRADRLSEYETYLSSIYAPNKERLLGAKVLEMQIPVLVRNKSFGTALATCETIVKDFPQSEMARKALRHKWLIHFNNTEDLGAAKTAMDNYGSKFANDEDHIYMRLAMNEITRGQVENLLKTQSIASKDRDNTLPATFKLSQNYPNPFNPQTKIQIGLPKDSDVELQIFNVRGQVVATLFEGNLPAGSHTVNFNASSLPSGTYFYKITAGEFTDVKKMVLVK